MSATPQTVSGLSILFMVLSLLICFGLPIGLAAWGKVKYKKAFSFLPLLAGVLGFLISQVIFRLTLITYVLPQFGWYQQFMKTQWPYLIFLCFTAGLVEEPARFIAYTVMKKRRQFPDGLSYGIGHGGFEAMIITGLSFINNIALSAMINSGTAASLGGLIPQQTIDALVSTPSYMFVLGGVERISAIAFHIALSLVVLKGFQTNRKWLFLALSFLLHGLGNLLALSIAQLAGAEASEAVLLIVGALSVLYIVKQAKQWRKGLTISTEEVFNGEQGQADHP